MKLSARDKPVVVPVLAERTSRRRLAFMVVPIVLVTLVIAGNIFTYYQQRSARVHQDVKAYQSNIDSSMQLRADHKPDQAVDRLQDYVQGAKDRERKIYALVNIANIYETEQKNADALKAYRDAEVVARKDLYIIDFGIARTSLALNDKTTAIAYYKKCLPMLQAELQKDPSRAHDIDDINSILKNIETMQ